MNPLCPLCDVRMRTLDDKLVCPLCGHSRPAHGHKIEPRAAAVLLGALLALPACGGAVADPVADHFSPQPSDPQPIPESNESIGVRLAAAWCERAECPPAGILSLPPGETQAECEANALHAIGAVPGLSMPCAAEWADALEGGCSMPVVRPACMLQH